MTKFYQEFLKDSGLDSNRQYQLERVLSNNITIMGVDDIWLDESFVLEVAKARPKSLWNLKASLYTQEIANIAVSNLPEAIENIPPNYITYELAKCAVRDKGCLINYIPTRIIDDELCEIAAKTSLSGLKLMEDKVLAESIALSRPDLGVGVLEYVSKEKMTSEFVIKCVRSRIVRLDAESLNELIGDVEFNEKQAFSLVACVSRYYSLLPDSLKTARVSKVAINNGFDLLHQVPVEHLTRELCELAIQINSNALKYVPADMIDQDLCVLAAEQHSNQFRLTYVPLKFRNEAVCLSALKSIFHFDINLKEVPDVMLKERGFLLKAVNANRRIIKFVKDELNGGNLDWAKDGE